MPRWERCAELLENTPEVPPRALARKISQDMTGSASSSAAARAASPPVWPPLSPARCSAQSRKSPTPWSSPWNASATPASQTSASSTATPYSCPSSSRRARSPHLHKFPRPLAQEKTVQTPPHGPGFPSYTSTCCRPAARSGSRPTTSRSSSGALSSSKTAAGSSERSPATCTKTAFTGVMTDYEAKFHEQGVKINRLVAVSGEAWSCG